MAVTRHEDTRVTNVRASQMKRSTNVRVIAGAITLSHEDADVIAIDGGESSRTVTLPPLTGTDALVAEAARQEGRGFEIWNVGSSDNVVIAAAAGNLATVTPGHCGFARLIGGAWRAVTTVTDTT